MRHPTSRIPDYPALHRAPGLAEGAVAGLSLRLAQAGRHDPYNVFEVEGVEKWGRPARFRLSAVRVSDAPFDGVPAEETRDGALHLLFETDRGERFGVSRSRAATRPAPQEGVLLQDRLGRTWFCGERAGAAPLTGSERLRPVPDVTAPLLRDTVLGGADLRDRLPAAGRFRLGSQGEVIGVEGGLGPVDPDLLARVSSRVEALVAREERIRRVAERHFGEGALDGLLLGRGFPIEGGLIPAYHAFDARRAFDEALFAVTRRFLEELRAEGLLAPCPNNGPRGVGPLEAWNRWLSGAYDAPPEARDREDRYGEHRLAEAPGFKTVSNCLIRAVVEMERRVWERNHPGEKYGSGSKEAPVDEAEVEAGFRDACARIITAYAEEETPDNIGFIDLQGRQTSERFMLEGSFLTPVLCAVPADYASDPVPLPPLEAPRSVRHLELSLPSGTLVMADWFRIDGFNEGLRMLLGGEDDFEINYADGLDARARAYFERAGLVIVQVGNTSPAAYADTPGVWRMGHVDEDHDAFWTEEGEPRPDLTAPEPVWRTCTDLWANTFADREVILDILMASEKYPDRADALSAFEAYAQEYGVSVTELGVDRIHLYVPTGHGVQAEDFSAVFRAAEITPADWREDAYVLSATPLTVDPDLLAPCDWRERARVAPDPAPEP